MTRQTKQNNNKINRDQQQQQQQQKVLINQQGEVLEYNRSDRHSSKHPQTKL